MKNFKQIALSAALASAALFPLSANAVNISGVEFVDGSQFITTSLWESQLTSSNGSLSGVGIVNQIANDGGVGTTWVNGQNGVQLTYYFEGFSVAKWYDTLGNAHIAGDDSGVGYNFLTSAVKIDFTVGTVKLYVDSISSGTQLNPSAGGSTIASDITKATDGTLWLSYIGHTYTSLTGRTGTLLSSTDLDKFSNIHAGGTGVGYLDVDGGLAASNFDTDSYNLGNSGIADAYFSSEFSTTNAGAWPLSGTASIKTTAIPEPGTLALAGLGLLGLGFGGKRRKAF